ncbi:MAG: hypothetical protein ACLTKG_05100 [Collinsella intestinalis]
MGATDNIACGLIRAAIDAARIVMDNPSDARAELMWIGTSHNGLAGCGLASPAARRRLSCTAWNKSRPSIRASRTARALPSSSRVDAPCGRAILSAFTRRRVFGAAHRPRGGRPPT